jgi:hypothetical protein
MNENRPLQQLRTPLGSVEPHAPLLKVPSEEQLIYKIMSVENLLRSVIGNYLHFNRVDSYADFPRADPSDGQQLPKDRQGNAGAKFVKASDYSAADYYDQSRARTYACCFSLENTDSIWNNYANDSAKGKICIVFSFGRLRTSINRILQPGTAALKYNGKRCHQIFSVNYGLVEYIEWENHQANREAYPNPIIYTYLKDKQYSDDKELRISLSALGIGHFVLNNGIAMQFPGSLQLFFDFRTAIADQTIQQILYASDCHDDFLKAELHKLRIVPSKE